MIDEVIFGAYLIGLLAIGVWTYNKAKTMEDFFVAGRRLKAWLATATIAATWIGGGITIGVAAKAYAGKGISLWATTLGLGSTLILVGLFYAKPLRRLKLLTLADFFSEKFNGRKGLSGTVSFILALAYIFAITAQIVAGGRLIQVVWGWDYKTAVIISGLIVTVYTILGGLWSVSLTDFIQLILVFIGVFGALILGINAVGFDATVTKAQELGLLDFGKIILAFDFWALFIVFALGDVPAPDLMQRIFGSENERTAQISSLLGGFFYYIMGVLALLIGSIAAIKLPNLSDPELALPMLVKTMLPAGVSGLAVAGLMAAVMSNADSMLLAPATLIAKNIYKDIINPQASDEKVLNVSRISLLAIGIFALVLSTTRAGIVEWLYLAWDVIFATAFFPLTLGLWWSRTTYKGAFAGVVGGGIARIILEILSLSGTITQWWVASLGAPVISLVLTVLFSLTSE
ncbi:sodium:solute symporter family protein [Thermococcus bergensis]|uniref:sodium:solute symporter family protein n=1 Tax=Thermococcus bergensis TaxID=2689387 RepID=UPI001CED4862|nr:sodium:solute symporter family protein [Thermococcus bergensis]MCA6214486.1 sodium:solute symporter family protein [Thermococcus bergensis]